MPGERHEQLGIVKGGKEADVHLVARHGDGRIVMLAEKRFRPRERRAFRHDWAYRAPMRKATRFGKQAIQASWTQSEWNDLVHLHAAGATVPPPAELLEDGYRMAFIGDGDRAAPRLADVDLDREMAERVWRELLDEVATFVAADRVHGDLSTYNVLWWRERAVVIDLSQTVDVITHPAALEPLERDLRALGRYFARRGVEIDVARALEAVGADPHRFARRVS